MSDVPIGGPNVLHLTETTGGGTDGVIGWANGQSGWDGAWTLSGLFYTDTVNTSTHHQKHEVLMYYDGSGDNSPIMARLGFTDPDSNLETFRILGDSIDNIETTHSVNWSEKTWYHYEITHDGNGTYTGRLWEEGDSRPSSPQARSTGDPPGTEARVAAIDINGAAGAAFDINHAFMKWTTRGGGGRPQTRDLPDIADFEFTIHTDITERCTFRAEDEAKFGPRECPGQPNGQTPPILSYAVGITCEELVSFDFEDLEFDIGDTTIRDFWIGINPINSCVWVGSEEAGSCTRLTGTCFLFGVPGPVTLKDIERVAEDIIDWLEKNTEVVIQFAIVLTLIIIALVVLVIASPELTLAAAAAAALGLGGAAGS